MIEYILKKSKGSKVKITIDKNQRVVVTAPSYVKPKDIDKIVCDNEKWIKDALCKTKEKMENALTFTEEEKVKLKNMAKSYIPPRVVELAKLLDVVPSKISITSAKTRWGSCSGKNSLNFSFYIMLLDGDLIDYIIIHELSHILEKNHSPKFYKVIEKVMPDYQKKIKRLKKFEKENLIL